LGNTVLNIQHPIYSHRDGEFWEILYCISSTQFTAIGIENLGNNVQTCIQFTVIGMENFGKYCTVFPASNLPSSGLRIWEITTCIQFTVIGMENFGKYIREIPFDRHLDTNGVFFHHPDMTLSIVAFLIFFFYLTDSFTDPDPDVCDRIVSCTGRDQQVLTFHDGCAVGFIK
jgi:hypothetical protein